jgi:O-antigen ligase
MLIKTSKMFYVLLVLYYGWFQTVFFEIPNMLLFLGSGMIGFIILHALQTGRSIFNSITKEIKIWILFAFTSLMFGLIVAVNQGLLIRSIITFVEFLILMFGIVYISNQDRNINFFVNVFVVFAIISAITTLFWGVEIGHGRISMGLSDNPNSLGMIMAIGICCILYKQNFNKLFYSLVAFSAIFMLIYVCILTGSRKSFLVIIAIIIYWLIYVAFTDIKALQLNRKAKGLLSILLLLGGAYFMLYPYFIDSVMFSRLNLLSDTSNEIRLNMYLESFELFKQSPLVGIGLNNYRAVSRFQTYTHSTIMEALACTGIIGSFLYFTPYISLLSNYKKILKCRLDASLLRQAKIMLGLFGVLLLSLPVIIHIYNMTSSITFGMIIAFFNINYGTNKEISIEPHISENGGGIY